MVDLGRELAVAKCLTASIFSFSLDQRKSREKALKKELLALRRQMQKERRSRGSGEMNSVKVPGFVTSLHLSETHTFCF